MSKEKGPMTEAHVAIADYIVAPFPAPGGTGQ